MAPRLVHLPRPNPPGRSSGRRLAAGAGALLVAARLAATVALVLAGLLGTSFMASGATFAAVSQCNGTDNVGGQAVSCDVTIVNNLNLATGLTSSTVTVRECHGAANAPLTCTTSTTTSAQLTTSVSQCNGSGNGGGGTVACTVNIINNITGTAATTPATVNQCNGSGAGGGIQPTVLCIPIGNTTNATITQCNGSGNGGGGTMRVRCTVTPSTQTSALPVTINQCNNSGNGGGGTVTCTVSLTNNIIPTGGGTPTTATPTTATPTTATPTTATPTTATPTTGTPTTGTAPTTTGLTPASGPTGGGTRVTVMGTGFVPSRTSVTIGGVVVPAARVTVVIPTSLSFVTPAHAAGTVNVTVTTPGGTSGQQAFRYVAAVSSTPLVITSSTAPRLPITGQTTTAAPLLPITGQTTTTAAPLLPITGGGGGTETLAKTGAPSLVGPVIGGVGAILFGGWMLIAARPNRAPGRHRS